ncbi:hypothetical protein B0I37DRAFT_352699 [Chaetomium sp. MPI-CAGE-AT-0009]|nr:hypothetical protein B0I37DRAFT_352699 [Chaetomium sp. MPI-CAGE-AT-0009]
MDAQNAAEPAFTKPAASPKRPGSDSDHPKPAAVTKLSSVAKPELSHRENRPSTSCARPSDEDGAADGNSDAETIVLPGKDGHSPSKVRKIIKHEKSDTDEAPSSLVNRKHSLMKQERESDKGDQGDRPEKPARPTLVTGAESNESTTPSILGKKKKHLDKPKVKDGSSGLSSAPGSPPQPQRRRRLSNAHSRSDSETAPVDSTKTSTKDKSKPLDKAVPPKRKAPRPDSDDEAENRKIRRQRTSGSGLDASRKHHLPSQKSHHEPPPSIRTRSISPHSRAHRRSASTQLLAHSNGLSQKKKRVPAPLQSTDYHSDDSSASGSPHPRSSKLRGLATPATADSTVSPAKMAPHKKHLDAHGQTFLARACAKGEYDTAKHRLQDRPEDINVADYAGNTPLQIAALNGYDDIVKLLVEAGCNLDCVNNDKDTPLLDAVENGHLDVVKILLEAGVNPRKANAYGQEPIDRVNDELDFADEIRGALNDAKQKMGERRRTSEEHHTDLADARSSYGPDSPRRSPGASSSIHAGAGRRAGTVRATKTSNHLLYMPMDDKTLRSAAARGDEETVTRILQVRENFDDPESMVAAARGGHDIVMQLLLALGKANPDPSPIPSPNSEHSTPMLAAIGQENIKVVRLLLDQTDFDPTRRIKGEAYHEIARRRRGPNWMEEEHMLKDAYDEHRKSHKDISKNRSPSRREVEREARRRLETMDESAKPPLKRRAISPTREVKRLTAAKLSASPKEKRRTSSFSTHQDDQPPQKRGPGRPPKKDDRIHTIAIPDREQSPAGKPMAKFKRAESDMAAVSSEGEAAKPRRKLVSGRELKGERDRQRRPSLASIASSIKEPSSPRDESDKTQMTEKYHDRTKALKRDESRDRLSVSGDSINKRHRSSATPPHPGHSDKDGGEAPIKRRRLDVDGKEKRPKSSQSDDRLLKPSVPRDPSSGLAAGPRPLSKTRDEEDRRPTSKPKKTEALLHHGRRESGKSISSEGSIHVKSEDPDVEMPDAAPSVMETAGHKPPLQKDKQEEEQRKQSEHKLPLQKDKQEEEQRKQSELEARARETKRKEEEKRRRDEEEKEKERLRREEESRKLATAEARKRQEEDHRQKEEEERERERKRKEEERRRLEEEERKEREEAHRRRVQEEEQRKREEAERRRREEEERRQKEEEERKRRDEMERLRQEQLEREAAEEARRRREEEEKREQERKERALREEMERRRAREAERAAERAAKEADQQRIRLEQERARLDKLPPVLRWLDGVTNPKQAEFAEKFSAMQGVRYDCIDPETNGTSEGREQWLLNTQVALLLGEKDLDLGRYTGWARRPVSPLAKRALWRLESDRYALTTPALFDLGKQLPGYYQEKDPRHMPYRMLETLRAEAWEKFAAMEMFFVKAADFLYIIPTIQHLRNVKLTVTYCELPENELQSITWTPRQKWRHDPVANGLRGSAPSNKHYVNGKLVSEDKPSLREASTSPFPRQRVPRRGLVAAAPEDPAHASLPKELLEDHLMIDAESPVLPNGVHTSPTGVSSHAAVARVNGVRPPALVTTIAANGAGNHPISPSSEAGPAQARPLVNGTHGTVTSTE